MIRHADFYEFDMKRRGKTTTRIVNNMGNGVSRGVYDEQFADDD